jgi:hypothetical protein
LTTNEALVALVVTLESIFNAVLLPLALAMVNVPVPKLIVFEVPPFDVNPPPEMVRLGLLTLKSSVPLVNGAVIVPTVAPFSELSTTTFPPPDDPSKLTVSPACLGMPPVAAQVPTVPPVADAQFVVLPVFQ